MKKDKYKGWIRAFGNHLGGRPKYADQTPGSMALLAMLLKVCEPTRIIELGTSHGLSTRLWLEQTEDIPITCIDASFKLLYGGMAVLPLDIERLTLIEEWVHDVRLQDCWREDDKVLMYVDIHTDHQHVMDAVPDLPNGSIVVFDDVWRSNKRLVKQEDKDEFLKTVVEPQIDSDAPRAIWPLRYSDYWKRGGFWGFNEVPLICEWAEENKVTLHWEKGVKIVWFQWPSDKA